MSNTFVRLFKFMAPEWVRSIRDQCRGSNVPFFFKQWGGVFKSRAGRELDGRTWDEMLKSVTKAERPLRVDKTDRVHLPVNA